jgi:hypothetical protein
MGTVVRRPIPYTHCSKPPDDDIVIDAIPIANDISWRLLPTVGFGQLTGNPMGVRACGHTQPQKCAARMLQDQKSIQQPKRERRHYGGQMRAIRAWVELTFADVLPLLGVPESEVEEWVNRFSEPFRARVQTEIDHLELTKREA